jgi:hypothetical protein
LTRGLKETFPDLVFIENANRWDYDNLPFIDGLQNADGGGVFGRLPPPDWLARRERGAAVDWSWLRDLPWGFRYLPSMWNWRVGGGRWAFEAPTLEHGSLQAAYKKGDTDEKRFVDKLFRVLGKVTTNWLHMDVPAEWAGNVKAETWAGFDALRWCAERPRRRLDGIFKPATDWSFPDDHRWYQGLGSDRGIASRLPPGERGEPPLPPP